MITVGRKIMSVNTKLCDVWGYKKEEIVNRNTCFLYSNIEDYRNVGFLLQSRKEFTYKTKLKRKDGSEILSNIKVTKNEEENYVTVYFSGILEES